MTRKKYRGSENRGAVYVVGERADAPPGGLASVLPCPAVWAVPSRLGAKAYASGDLFSSGWLFRLRCFSGSFSLRFYLGPPAVDLVLLPLLFLGLLLDCLVFLDVFGGELNPGGLSAEHILHRVGQHMGWDIRRGDG